MFTPYRPGEGVYCRQVTASVACLVALITMFKLGGAAHRDAQPLYFLLALPLALASSFLLINHPRFADYLIGVQEELRQFVWPRPATLVRGCLLVLAAIAMVTVAVVGFDLLIWAVLRLVSA